MTTYLFLNLLFLLTIVLFLPAKYKPIPKAWWITLAIVVGLTAVFDPIIIALDIVAYDTTKLLGIFWFGAPIEDFFYAIYAVIMVPLVWNKLEERRRAS